MTRILAPFAFVLAIALPQAAQPQRAPRSDLQLVQDVRRVIVDDKSLSSEARNVTILADHGVVTLRGQVRDPAELRAVEEHAVRVAGRDHVLNQLAVER